MIENYAEIIDRMTQEEAIEVVSKMGMNITDHPYLSEERRKELKEDLLAGWTQILKAFIKY